MRLFRLLPPLLMTACVQKTKIDARTLIIGVESEVRSLDFRSAIDANSEHVLHLFSQGLVRLNENALPEGDLATSFKVDKAQTYTFQWPENATFQDGQPVRCDDVKASFEQAAMATRMRSDFTDVAELKCLDPRDFRIRLKSPRASFMSAVLPAIRILPRAQVESKTPIRAPIGSGPYRFVKREGRDLVFERFAAYPMPLAFDKVIVRTIEDPTTRLLSLLGGDIDILFNSLSPSRVQEAAKSPYLKVYRGPGNNFAYLGMNLRLPKFQDPRVRRALALAIDRDGIIKHKLLGFGQPAVSVLSPPSYFQDHSLKPIPYDPDQARKLLREAGAEKLEVELKCSSDRDVLSLLLVIKEQWERLGLKVNLKPYEFGTFFADVQKGNFEMYSLRWTSATDPDLLNKIFHSRELPPGRNRVYYSNASVDRWLDQAAVEANSDRRRELYDKIQRQVAEEMVYIPLWYPDNIAVASNQVTGFKLDSSGSWMSFLKAKKETP